jgi:hypothetical protein
MSLFAPSDAEVNAHHGPRRGVAAVRDAVMLLERGRVQDLGIYNRRRIAGSRSWSTHAAGRGWDAGCAPQDTARLGLAFMRAAGELGIVEVIALRRIWRAGEGIRDYHGPAHLDHVHLSFSPAFADSNAGPEVARALCALVWARHRPPWSA